MPILIINCKCGGKLRVREGDAAGRARCPSCSRSVAIPRADAPAPRPARRRDAVQLGTTRGSRAGTAVAEVEPVEDVLPVLESDRDRPRRRDEDDPPPPPRRKKRRPLAYPEDSGGGFFSGQVGLALGGLGMMLLAVVWFVVGLFGGYIFFYPPVLFVAGVVSLLRGLNGRD